MDRVAKATGNPRKPKWTSIPARSYVSPRGTELRSTESGLAVTTPQDSWSDAGYIPIARLTSARLRIKTGSVRLFIRAKLLEGSFGVRVSESKNDTDIKHEKIIDSKSPEFTVDLGLVPTSGFIKFRNCSPLGASKFALLGAVAVEPAIFDWYQSLTAPSRETIQNAHLTKTVPLALRDGALRPFVHRFEPRFAFESEFDLFVTSTRAIENAYFKYKHAPLAIFPPIQNYVNLEKPIYWDIGANLGVSTVQLARYMAKFGGFSVALECEPENAAALSQNFRLNGVENAAVLQIAAGDSNGLRWLNINSNSHVKSQSINDAAGGHSGLGLHTLKNTDNPAVNVWGNYGIDGLWALEVRLETLVRTFGFAAPDFLFIDAAMYENEVVDGFESLIVRGDRPLAIMIEQTPGGADRNKAMKVQHTRIWKKLSGNGYQSFEIDSFSIDSFHKDHQGAYMMTLFMDEERLSVGLAGVISAEIAKLNKPTYFSLPPSGL